MQEPAGEPVFGLRAAWPQVALVASAVFVLLLGVFPDFFVTVAGDSVRSLPL